MAEAFSFEGVKPLTARDHALRSASFIAETLERRERMSPEEREAAAERFESAARSFAALAALYPNVLEMAGLRSIAAKIMRAEG